MADTVRVQMMMDGGWQLAQRDGEDLPGIYVRSPELREAEKIDWMVEPTDLLLQIENATRLRK